MSSKIYTRTGDQGKSVVYSTANRKIEVSKNQLEFGVLGSIDGLQVNVGRAYNALYQKYQYNVGEKPMPDEVSRLLLFEMLTILKDTDRLLYKLSSVIYGGCVVVYGGPPDDKEPEPAGPGWLQWFSESADALLWGFLGTDAPGTDEAQLLSDSSDTEQSGDDETEEFSDSDENVPDVNCSDMVPRLEAIIDKLAETLPPLTHFVQMCDYEAAVLDIHQCRVHCRSTERDLLDLISDWRSYTVSLDRAERYEWMLSVYAEQEALMAYLPWLNRLSDYLFMLARFYHVHFSANFRTELVHTKDKSSSDL